jgi:prepilin-type N-terminal cleavage/methylation domain-containing protein
MSRSRRGFTLVEMMLALALVGLVMVGLNTFIFSMTELWGRNLEPRRFDQHVRAVTRYLESELRAAALPPTAARDRPGIAPAEVRNEAGVTEELLTFELPAGSRLFTWPERPLPDVVCALAVRREVGLVLLWHSRLERDFESDAPRELVLTPLATGIAYEYYDPAFRKWETVPALRKTATGELERPGRLRLSFTHGALKRDSLITLPTATEGLPVY